MWRRAAADHDPNRLHLPYNVLGSPGTPQANDVGMLRAFLVHDDDLHSSLI